MTDTLFANMAPRDVSQRHYGDFPFGGHDVSHWGVRLGWWLCRDGVYRCVYSRSGTAHWQCWRGDGMAWGDCGNYVPQPEGATPHPYDLREFVGLDCGGGGYQWTASGKAVACRCNRCQGVE